MKERMVYVAELGNSGDVILRELETIVFSNNNLTIVGTEVFGSPFDALVKLNYTHGIKPEQNITIYETKVLDKYLIKIDIGETYNTHIISTIELILDKKCTMALGTLVHYLKKQKGNNYES